MSQLAITLRPRTFDEVIGQTDVVAALRKMAADKPPRALMLVGPAGTGKTTLARILAREIQGPIFAQQEDFEPDVTVVNAARTTKMEDCKKLVDLGDTFPRDGQYRVIILDEAQQISAHGQQVLLASFESEKTTATVWMICTTDPQKINKALRTRCETFVFKGLNQVEREQLLQRAADALGRTASYGDFTEVINKRGLDSPRSILNAFEVYNGGVSAEEAVSSVIYTDAPEFADMAYAVVYGSWDKPCMRGGQKIDSVLDQLKKLEATLKKKQVAEDVEGAITDEDVARRPDTARSVRAVLAAFLKGKVLKGDGKAAECLYVLADWTIKNEFDVPLEYPLMVAVLYRICAKLKGDK